MERKETASRQASMRDRALLCAVATALVAACTSGSPSIGSLAPASAGPSTGPPVSAPAGPTIRTRDLDSIRAVLEAQIGVAAPEPKVVSVEAAAWPDGAMGCPRPGEIYTQAIVEGQRVVVDFDGTEYDFRVSDQGVVRFCGPA